MVLLYLLPLLAGMAFSILLIKRVKKGYRPPKMEPKRMALNLLLWIGAALVLVVALNLMQSARH